VPPGGDSASSDVDDTTAAPDAAVVTTEDVDWLVGRLQAMVTASPAVWAGRGMTLLQLIALHFIGALAPATLTDLAHVLNTCPPPRPWSIGWSGLGWCPADRTRRTVDVSS
jgi:hypothetical protein